MHLVLMAAAAGLVLAGPALAQPAPTTPVVVSTVPAAGSQSVPPGPISLDVTFSQPLAPESWSFSSADRGEFPKMIGEPHLLSDGRTVELTIETKPGTAYAIWLNDQVHHGFRSRDGVPALPYLLAFRTAAEPPKAQAETGAGGPCAYDKDAMLALDPAHFDQDLNGGGWRKLGSNPKCFLAAADLLAAYRQAHWGTLKPGELHINYWHEGQVRAMGGQTREAVPLLLAGVGSPDVGDFADYALGTVAFLDRDLEALKSARARLAAQPEPAWFAKTRAELEAKHLPIRWPMNLDVLDGLVACFDKPYAEAYGVCRPKPK